VEKGDGIDFYFEKCGVEYAVDIKTAQINAKNGRTFYETFVRWMIFRQLRKNGRVRFRPRLVIPYDAEFEKSGGKIDWWATYKGRAAPLERQDVWVGNEFWSELTDCTTAWKAIQEGFMEVSPALRPLYEPLLTKQIKVNDLKMLLEAYGVDRVATGRGGAALSRDCECGKSCALSVTALASIAKEPVRCRVKTCSQIVLDSSGVDWLRGAGGVRRA
jgi:hypothetical protein